MSGFNCGEAVNFAMADWFPFGAAACLRYEFLNRIPLLPHEELLCKEAMIVSQMGRSSIDAPHCKQQNFVKVAFVTLMRSQLQAHAFLKQRGAKITTSNVSYILCGLCKHTCYIAYTICNCYPEPICVNHGNIFDNTYFPRVSRVCARRVIVLVFCLQTEFSMAVCVEMIVP